MKEVHKYSPYRWVSCVALICACVVICLPQSASALELRKIHIHGYLDVEYNQSTEFEGTESGAEGDPTNGSFDIRHFNLLMDFNILPELAIKTHVEYDHGADTEIGLGGIILEYAFFEYRVSDSLKFRGGKGLTPFGLYNEIHDATPAYLSVAVPESVYTPHRRGGFAMTPKWNTGAYVLGDIPVTAAGNTLDYILYVGNGENLPNVNENQFDNNNNKAVGGRIQYTSSDDDWQVGLSGFSGDKAQTENDLAVNHTTLLASFDYTLDVWNLRGEYGSSTLGSRTETAWFVQTSYRIHNFTPYFRYQTLDPRDDTDDDYWNTIQVGVNYRLNPHMFLKLEWNDHRRGENNDAIITKGNENYGELRSAVTIYF